MSNITGEIPREKLKELVERTGESLLQDPDRCEGLLKDHCGSHRKEISALVGALEERVPIELKSSWQTAMTPEAMRARLVQRLEENRGLAPDVASWAVDAWSYALGVGLGRVSDRVDVPIVPPAPVPPVMGDAPSTWSGTPGPSIAERIASDRAGAASIAPPPSPAKSFSVAQMSTPRKAGAGAVVALLLGVGAFALINHHPTPTPPAPTPAPGPAPAPAPVPDPTPKPKPDDHQGPAGEGDGGTVKNDPGKTIPAPRPKPAPVEPARFLASGTLISVRIDQTLNSDDLNVGDTIAATVSSPITLDGNVIVSTGARAKLKVTAVDHTAKEGGAEHLQLALVDVTTEQGTVQISAPAHEFNGPTVHTEQLKRGGVGAAAGAVGGFVVGKLFHHGGAGAAAGAGGGAAVGVVTAKAQPVKVAAETPLQFRLSLAVKVPTQTTAKK